VPFRQAHHITGAAVRLAEATGCSLRDVPLAQLQTLHPAFADDVAAVWDFDASVERRDAIGGTSKRAVLAQIAALRAAANLS
jgi:argininosuccinate lyase